MADNFRFFQGQPYALNGSGALIGDTSIVLKSMKDIDGNSLSMATDFGTIGFGTLEPGNGANEEQICFTGLTNNSNGTTTLTGVKSVTFAYPYTQTSGLLKTHAGSTSFIISNTSGFYDELTSKSDDETITGTWTFTNPNYPRMDTATPAPTDDEQLATKKYVDDTIIAGAPDASSTVKGISKLSTNPVSPTDPIAVGDNDTRMPTQGEKDAMIGTSGTTPSTSNAFVDLDDTSVTSAVSKVVRGNASGKIDSSWLDSGVVTATSYTFGESITAGMPVYLKVSDGKVYKASAASANEAFYNYVGIALETGSANDVKTVAVTNGSIVSGLSLGNQTTSISSTAIVTQSDVSGGSLLNFYTGNSSMFMFISGTTQGNIEKFTLEFGANTGSGAGTATINLYEVTDYGEVTVSFGASLGSVTITPTASATNTFTFSSPVTIKSNTHYIVIITASAGSGANSFNIKGVSAGLSKSFSYIASSSGTTSPLTLDTTKIGGCAAFVCYSTLTSNYEIGDYLFLGDTAGTFSFTGGTKKLVVGSILSSSSISLGLPEQRKLLYTYTSLTMNASNILILPVPKNSVAIDMPTSWTNNSAQTWYNSFNLNVGQLETKASFFSLGAVLTSGQVNTTWGRGRLTVTGSFGIGTYNNHTIPVYFYK